MAVLYIYQQYLFVLVSHAVLNTELLSPLLPAWKPQTYCFSQSDTSLSDPDLNPLCKRLRRVMSQHVQSVNSHLTWRCEMYFSTADSCQHSLTAEGQHREVLHVVRGGRQSHRPTEGTRCRHLSEQGMTSYMKSFHQSEFFLFFFFLSENRKQQERVLSMFTPHVERTTVSPYSPSHTGCFVCSIYITAASLFPLSLASASACLVAVVSFHPHTVQPGSQSKTLTPTDWLSPRDFGEQGKQVLLTKAFSKQEGKKVPRGIRRSFPGTSHDGGFK